MFLDTLAVSVNSPPPLAEYSTDDDISHVVERLRKRYTTACSKFICFYFISIHISSYK